MFPECPRSDHSLFSRDLSLVLGCYCFTGGPDMEAGARAGSGSRS